MRWSDDGGGGDNDDDDANICTLQLHYTDLRYIHATVVQNLQVSLTRLS